jgi:hypothetical protein
MRHTTDLPSGHPNKPAILGLLVLVFVCGLAVLAVLVPVGPGFVPKGGGWFRPAVVGGAFTLHPLYMAVPWAACFVLGLLDWHRPWRVEHLDLLALAGFFPVAMLLSDDASPAGLWLAAVCLGWLFARMLGATLGTWPMPELRPSISSRRMGLAILILLLARTGTVAAAGNIADVGQASSLGGVWALVIAAERPVARGLLLAAAALTKFLPALLALQFLGPRQGRARYALTLVASLAAMLAWPLVTSGPDRFFGSTFGYQLIQRGGGVQFSIWTYMPQVAIMARPVLAVALVLLALSPMWRPDVQDARKHAAFAAALLIGAQLLLGYWFYSYLTWCYPLLVIAIIRARPDHQASSPPAHDAATAADVAAPARANPQPSGVR